MSFSSLSWAPVLGVTSRPVSIVLRGPSLESGETTLWFNAVSESSSRPEVSPTQSSPVLLKETTLETKEDVGEPSAGVLEVGKSLWLVPVALVPREGVVVPGRRKTGRLMLVVVGSLLVVESVLVLESLLVLLRGLSVRVLTGLLRLVSALTSIHRGRPLEAPKPYASKVLQRRELLTSPPFLDLG